MIRYLLDTNIVSEPIRPAPNERILSKLRLNQDFLAIASPVWHELRYGSRRLPISRRRDRIEQYIDKVVLRTLPVLSYDRIAADWHAEERARLVEAGKPPSFVDGQIAAVAATNDLVLVTRNVGDFIAFRGLRIEDWGERD